jgi:transcriptional regulator with XRE-family HTH domain
MGYVAANVRRIRLQRALTQEELAEAAGIDTAYVARVERAVVNVTVATLAELADGLRVEPGELLVKAKMHRVAKGRPRKG